MFNWGFGYLGALGLVLSGDIHRMESKGALAPAPFIDSERTKFKSHVSGGDKNRNSVGTATTWLHDFPGCFSINGAGASAPFIPFDLKISDFATLLPAKVI